MAEWHGAYRIHFRFGGIFPGAEPAAARVCGPFHGRRTMSPRFTTALAAGLGALTAFPVAAIDLPEIPHEFYTLDNGLEVILHEDHSTPIVGVNVWYHVGSKNERPGRSGFAHLFEHMMFQGSAHQDGEYFEPLQSVGADANGSTNEDRTNYWELLPAHHLERALLLEADRMGWLLPAMTEEKFKNQQDVVRNERRQGEGNPYSAFWLNFNENFYPKGHPYDHSVIGIHEDLANATLDDVKDFFRQYYTPNNATLCIAGDFEKAAAKQWIERYFGEIPPGPPIEEVAVWIPEMKSERRLRYEDEVQLTRLHWAWHTPPYYHEGDADLDLAAKILGQGRTSRLYKRLVHAEKLAQDVEVFQWSGQVSSSFIAEITLRPDADPARVESIFDEELAKLAKKGPTREELEQAKSDFEAGFIKSVQKIGGWGGKNDKLNHYNHFAGTPDYFRKDYERYMSRTPDTVREQFARWIGPGRMVVEIRPLGDLAAAAPAELDRSALPAGGPPPPFEAPRIGWRTLPNGLELAVMEHRELPLVRVNLVFRSGTRDDPAQLGGLADLAAAMHLEGTASMDKFEFESELEKLGTDLSVSAEDDQIVFSLQCLTKHLDASLDLLAAAITQPAFPETEFLDQKERRANDVRREKDDPVTTQRKVTRRILFGDGHPYSRPRTGTVESLEAIAISDAKEFSQAHLVPANATLVAVGDVGADHLALRVEHALGAWSGAAPSTPKIPEPAPRTGVEVYLVDKPGDSQSTISIGHAGIPRNHPDWEKIFVANRVLGGFFSSRLNLNLREDKGYSYGVRSSTWELEGPSLFAMSGRVQTEVTAPAITEFMNELRAVAGERPITPEELDFAKDSILLGYTREFETIGQLADAVTDQVVFGLPDDEFARYPDKIAAVDVDAANRAAAGYFRPDRVAVVVVGDLAKIEEPIRSLGLGPIRRLDADGRPIGSGTDVSTR
jgi:zinc protease